MKNIPEIPHSKISGISKIKRITLLYPGQAATAAHRVVFVHLPLSSLSLAAYLRERGYGIDLFDMRIHSNDQYDFSETDALGIGCMTGHQIRYGLEAARRFRAERPDAPIIWGGVHPSLYPEQTARHALVDYVVIGEGEEALYRLLRAIEGKQPIETVKSIAYKRAGDVIVNNEWELIKDLDSLPMPAYDMVNLDDYSKVREKFDYQTSRGCPFRCSFCYNLNFTHRRWRAKSPEKSVSEITELRKKYGVEFFSFVDDELFINRRRTEAILDGLIEADLGIRWSASCRLDILMQYPEEVMQKIKQSGCRKLYFGAESGSQRILDAIQKDIRVDMIFGGAEKCIRNGIVPVLSFMSGFPDESLDDLMQTYRVISDLWKIDDRVEVNGVFIYNPYPGGPLFDRAVQMGVELPPTFDEWGEWTFKYDARLPWVDAGRRKLLRSMFFMVRYSYYRKELRNSTDPVKKYLGGLFLLPLAPSFALRWKNRWFARAWEWYLWAWLMKRSFGFL